MFTLKISRTQSRVYACEVIKFKNKLLMDNFFLPNINACYHWSQTRVFFFKKSSLRTKRYSVHIICYPRLKQIK